MTVRMYHPDLDNWMITCSEAAAQVHALKGWIELPDEDPVPADDETESTEPEASDAEPPFFPSLDDIGAGASTEGRSTAPEDDATPAEDEEEEH